MLTRYVGALSRALLMAFVILLPAVFLPSVAADTAQIVALMALFAAALAFFEYASVYPGLIEFRDAPPFNRIRFLCLLAMVTGMTLIALVRVNPSTLALLAEAVGLSLGRVLDFPYSPVRLMLLTLGPDADPAIARQMQASCGVALLVSITTLAVFTVVSRLLGWPTARGSFNVWVNLPTFDPTAGGDVVDRLRRDAWYNMILGLLLPFLLPAGIEAVTIGFTDIAPTSAHTLIWVVTAWAFIPTCLFMRGLAIGRIAQLIEAKRQTGAASGVETGPSPARAA